MPPTKLQRWLDLIAFLVGRRLPVSYDELMSGVPAYAREYESEDETARASLRRKFERDKKELRDLGIPIQTIRYALNFGIDEVEGYQIDRRDFYLPYLNLVKEATAAQPPRPLDRTRIDTVMLAERDAPLALEGLQRVSEVPAFPLRREARSAFRKLAFGIDPDAFQRDTPVLFIDPPGSAALSEKLRMLSDALLARRHVKFSYHGIYRDEVTERDVAPYGLLFQHGSWYLVGHDASREAMRVFRVGRMGEVTPRNEKSKKPEYEIPETFSLDEYADRQAWELGNPEEAPVIAHVRFHFPLSLWAERNGHGELLERGADGSQVRSFELREVNPFLRWLMGLEGETEILEPASLQEARRELARTIAAAHGGSPA
jgi:predicted DNA-binding transcriptional regulator YafY